MISSSSPSRAAGVLAVVLVTACGEDTSVLGATTGAPGGPEQTAHLALMLVSPPTSILAGASIDVPVAVARQGTDAYDGDVMLSLETTDGFAASKVTLPRDASAATLTISVTASHRHGQAPVRIVANSTNGRASGGITLPLLVRGAPGALDTSFGVGGFFELGQPPSEATGLAVRPDGKVVLGGRIADGAVVVQLTADGIRDFNYGSYGVVRSSMSGVVSTHDVVVLADGSVVLGGSNAVSSFLSRFIGGGAPDPNFGSKGTVLGAEQSRSSGLAYAGGDLYVGGQAVAPSWKDALQLLHVLPSGAPDANWGSDGQAILPFAPDVCGLGDGACFTTAISPRSNGRVTACASRGNGVTFRELAVGGLEDRSFDLSTTADVLSSCTAMVSVTPDDFWAAGARAGDVFQLLHVTKSTAGPLTVDTSFRPTDVPATLGLGPATRVLVASPGRLVVSADAAPTSGAAGMALVRVDASTLALDPTFGGKGYVVASIGTTPVKSRALIVQPDGRIIVAGTNGDMVAARFWQ